jgi:uncharacterized protein
MSDIKRYLSRSPRLHRGLIALGGAAAIGLAGLAASACTAASASTTDPPVCSPNTPKLTVQGAGMTTGTPDILTVSVDISTTGATANAALADNNVAAAAVITAFRAGGVTSPNIQTTGLSVQPNYTFVNDTNTLAGYAVDDTVTATITDFSSAGSTLDAVSAAAGNAGQINSLDFSIKDPRALQDQARTDAVHQAVSHATAMAASAGEHLGPVCSLTDSTSAPPVVMPLGAMANRSQGSAVPVQAGSQQVNAQVTVVYALEVGSTGR